VAGWLSFHDFYFEMLKNWKRMVVAGWLTKN
jgi:hypothetical protein